MSDNIERRDADSRIWVLGAPDPAMAAIEALLLECGERVVYATTPAGERIRPGQQASPVHIGDATTVYTVECDPPLACGTAEDESDVGQVVIDGGLYASARNCRGISVIRIDHHQPGDPGYGRPPAEFLAASSIGQVIRELARIGAIPSTWRRMAAGYAAPLTPQYADGAPVDYTGLPWLRVGRDGKDAWDIVLDARTFARVPHELV